MCRDHQPSPKMPFTIIVIEFINWTLYFLSPYLHVLVSAFQGRVLGLQVGLCEQSRLVLLQGDSRLLELSREWGRVCSGRADRRESKALFHCSRKGSGPAGTRAVQEEGGRCSGREAASLRSAEERAVPRSPRAATEEPAVQQSTAPRGSATPRELAVGGTAAREDPCGAVCFWGAAPCWMRR